MDVLGGSRQSTKSNRRTSRADGGRTLEQRTVSAQLVAQAVSLVHQRIDEVEQGGLKRRRERVECREHRLDRRSALRPAIVERIADQTVRQLHHPMHPS